MTAICPAGGPSGPRPGFAASLFVVPAQVGALLNNWPTPWAVALAGYIGLVTYELSTFCTTDPPAVPTITAADVVGLLAYNNVIAHTTALAKFQQLIASRIWWDVCQCTAGATPAPPSPPSQPTGMPQISPPIEFPSGSVCLVQQFDFHFVGNDAGEFSPFVALPAGATSVDISATWTLDTDSTAPGAFSPPTFYWDTRVGAGPAITSTVITATDQSERRLHIAIPSTATVWRIEGSANTSTTTVHGNCRITVSINCGSGSTGVPSPTPCGTDPILQAQIDQILQLVTLIQRQAVPFAYVTKATHSALSGRGELAVQGLIGAIVTITSSISGSIGEEVGDPVALWGAGWVNWGTLTDGFGPREFLSGVTTLFLPPIGGVYTRLGYSLAPGVVATIREISREP